MSLDYLFGRGVGKKIDRVQLDFEYSRRTGRLRYVIDHGTKRILFSFRANGSIAPTVDGARLMLGDGKSIARKKKRPRFVVTVLDGITDLISQGKTVFCRHVVEANPSLRPGEDVIVLNERGELLAVGRTVVSSLVMKQFKKGVAVKVREGIRSRNGTAAVV
jgi:uncharacterized protein with predicted RNA binding PUA domain